MKKIAIIGAGFAGSSCAVRLSGASLSLEITLFDRKPEFNFLPLLPDCIGRKISLEFLVNDTADFCRKHKIGFIQQEVIAVDPARGELRTGSAAYAYDYLVIASGSQPNFFSDPRAQSYGYPLNNAADARKIIDLLREGSFENLIIVGGGYTGIEIATNLRRYFKAKGRLTKIIIIERAPEMLGPLPDWMKAYAGVNLKNLGIEVWTNSVVEKIWADKVQVSGGRVLEQAMLFWVPGVKTADFIQKMDIPKNPQGRIIVDEYLRCAKNCFCAGDAALIKAGNGFLRMAVQFSIKQGAQAAKNIIKDIKNIPLEKFRPLDLGYIIPMANNRSCGRTMGLNVRGSLATFLHFSMCIFRSRGWKNKFGIINNLIKGGGEC
jgi:NADH:ubiquinone reductase (H+-translocating)